MTNILTDAAKRLYALQVLFAALAIVLLLQIGARLESGHAGFLGNSIYGPPNPIHRTTLKRPIKKKSQEQRRLERLERAQ